MNKNIISLVGMSGVGKTHYASSQNPAKYFHYSVDYVIGSHLIRDDILDDLLKQITKSDFIKKLLTDKKISINANITVKDLSLISMFLGKFGSKEYGGLDKKEFLKRQKLYREAEKIATMHLQNMSEQIFSMGYEYILNDLTGSICEIINFSNKEDKIVEFLSQTTIKYLPANEEHVETLIERAKQSPKPLLFNEEFFEKTVENFIKEKNIRSYEEIIPDEFCVYSFPLLLKHRIPKYEEISKLC
jgi:hypothetical protein